MAKTKKSVRKPKPLASTAVMPLTMAVKLGSIAVHADEMLSNDGHSFDEVALKALLNDPEIVAWVRKMGALLPVKRKADVKTCTCGHVDDEHGTKDEEEAPNASECLIDGCGCIAFEWAGE